DASIVAATERLHRIRDVDELGFQSEPGGEVLAQSADADALRRVVAGGDEVEAGLLGLVHDELARLAGDIHIEALVDRLLHLPLRAAADDADAAHGRWSVKEAQAARAVELLDAPDQLLGGHPACIPLETDRGAVVEAKGGDLAQLEAARGEDIVADFRMAVQADVVAHEVEIVFEQQPQAPLHRSPHDARFSI